MTRASLDPSDWDAFRRTLHDAVDATVDELAAVRDGPAWRPVPDAVKVQLREPLPREGEPLEATYARFAELIAPYSTGNRHPRFFGWVHGAGTPAGVLAELLAAAMNSNVGGREHAAVYVEREVIRWFAELFGFPVNASGILTSGTSMGNLLAVVAARDAALGPSARAAGIGGARLTAYAGTGVHDSVAKALRTAGLGEDALRLVRLDDALAIDVGALRERIAADRAAGAQPFLVVATAGSVDSGAFDPLGALANLCAAEGLWLHAPYAVGCVLFRDERAHRAAFASEPEYLGRAERGTAAGAPWFTDYGLELSREFRALKVWFTLRHFGIDRLGESIARTCELATTLAGYVDGADDLELLAPVALNVVCFRFRRPGLDDAELDRLNEAIAVLVQESGMAVTSTTRIGGRRALRACIVNHRTDELDLDMLLMAVRTAARTHLAGPTA